MHPLCLAECLLGFTWSIISKWLRSVFKELFDLCFYPLQWEWIVSCGFDLLFNCVSLCCKSFFFYVYTVLEIILLFIENVIIIYSKISIHRIIHKFIASSFIKHMFFQNCIIFFQDLSRSLKCLCKLSVPDVTYLCMFDWFHKNIVFVKKYFFFQSRFASFILIYYVFIILNTYYVLYLCLFTLVTFLTY